MVRFLLIGFLFFSSKTFANSCCGQSPTSFPILALEQKLSVTTAYSLVESQGRVFNTGDFYIWDNKKREIQALRVNFASSLASRHQIYASTSLMRGYYSDSLASEHSQNLSDSQIGYSYEVLPEYSFSYWKPIIYLSALLNIPTGKSIYDGVPLSEGAGVTGHNQWGTGLGLTLRKVYFPLTLTLQIKSLKIFSKTFEKVRVSDFYDNSLALLFNYATNFEQVAINLGLTATYLTPRQIYPAQVTSGSMQNTTLLVGVQKVFTDAWSAGLNFSDQTLLGEARNTILNKTYSLNISYNYF